MDLQSAGQSVVGRRSNNEDAMLEAKALGLYVVADGLGGYEGGEVASKLTTQTLASFLEANRRDPQGTWPIREQRSRSFEENLLVAAGAAAHREILERKEGTLAQMGSTVVAAYFAPGGRRVTVLHCGDSRAYRLRDGRVEALTRDHSVWAEMEAAGLAGARQNFAWKNQITRALGLDGHATCDVATHEVRPGDAFLLCSDGLYDPLDDEVLARALRASPAEACASLVKAAFEAGSNDNITAVVVRCCG